MGLCAEGLRRDFIRKGRGTNVFTAVRELDISPAEGAVTMVCGRSGSGKSTLLNMLSGLLIPTAGRVLYDGRDIYGMGDRELSEFRNKNIGYIPQGSSALGALTVKENILLPTAFTGNGSGEVDWERLNALMDILNISPLLEAKSGELSGGELRRMAIARALALNPRFIFADEPTGDLDDENTEIVFKILRQEAGEGKTVLLVTHEGTAAQYSDRVFRMDAGVLKEE